MIHKKHFLRRLVDFSARVHSAAVHQELSREESIFAGHQLEQQQHKPQLRPIQQSNQLPLPQTRHKMTPSLKTDRD